MHPVRIKIWSNGMLPLLVVIASAYMPLWSTHLTVASCASMLKDGDLFQIGLEPNEEMIQVRARKVTTNTVEHTHARHKGTKLGNTEATTT